MIFSEMWEDVEALNLQEGDGLTEVVFLQDGGAGIESCERCTGIDHEGIIAAPVVQVMAQACYE